MGRILIFSYKRSLLTFFLLALFVTTSPRVFSQAQGKTEAATKLAGENRGRHLWKFETGG
jgi:hypothetical protein